MLLQFLRPACCDHLVYPNRPGRRLEQLQYCVRRGCWVSWGPFGQSRVHLGENNSDPSFSLKQERHQGWSARGEQSWMMWQLWRLWRGRNRSHHPWLPRWPLAPLWISLSSPVFWSTARIFWNHQPEKSSSVNSSVDAFSQNVKPTLDDSDGQGVVRWFLLFGAIFILFCWNWLTRFRSELDWIPGNRKNVMKSVFWSAALKQTENFNDLKSIEMRQMDDLILFEIKQTDVPILMFDLDQCCVSFASLLRGKSNRRKSAKISISLMQTWEATLSLQLCVTPTLPHHTAEWKCRIFYVDPGRVHNQYLREAFLSWCRYYSHPHTQAGQMSRCARFPSIRSDLLGPKIVSADRSKH